MEKKKDILALSLEDLKKEFLLLKEKAFRAKQVYEWLWKKSCRDFDEMTNLSLPLREQLKTSFFIQTLKVVTEQKSNDGTLKLLSK